MVRFTVLSGTIVQKNGPLIVVSLSQGYWGALLLVGTVVIPQRQGIYRGAGCGQWGFLDNCHVCTQWFNGVYQKICDLKLTFLILLLLKQGACYHNQFQGFLRSLSEARMSRFDSSLQKRGGVHLIGLDGAKLGLLQGGRQLMICLQCIKLAV